MAISIVSLGNGKYNAFVSPPDITEVTTVGSATVEALMRELRALGCHTTDISDGFYAANPDWLKDSD
jgi:phosphosulfolactate synthase (CoM biosynthesis protein A)